MAHMLVTHSVEDFDKWKAVFDEVKPMRDEAGEISTALYRDASDPNTITALFEWDSLENARDYAGSDRLKAAMQKAGVTGPPTITFLNSA